MLTAIKIQLVIIIALGFLSMPYGYYQFMRIAVCAGAIYLAINDIKEVRNVTGLIFIAIAILFNPIKPIHFEKNIWHIIDGIIIVGILILVFIKKKVEKY